MRVIVIGAGGHARVVLDILDQCRGIEIYGLLDDDPRRHGLRLQGRPVLGGTSVLERLPADGVRFGVVAVGDNARRRELCGRLRATGIELLSAAVHPSAVVSRHARLDAGTVVMPNAVVNAGARVGEGVVINTAAVVEHDCVVGDWSHVAPGARLGGAVAVGRGVLVGMGAVVLPRLTVGDGAVVGAASLVVSDVAAEVTVCGVPARLQGGEAQ
jgi:UDP-perosamine 4-acetyltransferase